MTFTKRVKHHIHTSDGTHTIHTFFHKAVVQNQSKRMLDSNIIRLINSPWSAPIWMVPKKIDHSDKQKWRIVIEFRRLGSKTINDKDPLPNNNDLLDKLVKCQYYIILDP